MLWVKLQSITPQHYLICAIWLPLISQTKLVKPHQDGSTTTASPRHCRVQESPIPQYQAFHAGWSTNGMSSADSKPKRTTASYHCFWGTIPSSTTKGNNSIQDRAPKCFRQLHLCFHSEHSRGLHACVHFERHRYTAAQLFQQRANWTRRRLLDKSHGISTL